MARDRHSKITLFMLVMLAVSLVYIYGCGGKEKPPDDTAVVAVISNYRMTIEDFRSEAQLTMANKGLSSDYATARKELLDELILKKVLLQEAQKENFDKDKAFMKEIERYWEQALLKLLIKKKAEELFQTVRVDETEVRAEYEKMAKELPGKTGSFERMAPGITRDIRDRKMQDALDKWITDLRKKTSVRINKKVLDKIVIR